MANARAVLGPAASEKMTTLAWVLASSGVWCEFWECLLAVRMAGGMSERTGCRVS